MSIYCMYVWYVCKFYLYLCIYICDDTERQVVTRVAIAICMYVHVNILYVCMYVWYMYEFYVCISV